MKTISIFQVLLIGGATALPYISPRQGSALECPEVWKFDIASYSGPGCPDSTPGFNATLGHTDQGWGSHFVPGCHTPWAWFSLPYTQATVGSAGRVSKTYCEMRLRWREMKGEAYPIDVPLDQASWRLKLHRNGSTIEAGYAIDERVRARWGITYWSDENDAGSQVRTTLFPLVS